MYKNKRSETEVFNYLWEVSEIMLNIKQLISLAITKEDLIGLSSDLVPLGEDTAYDDLLDDDARVFMDFYRQGYRIYPYKRLHELDYKQRSTIVGVVQSTPRVGEYTRKSGEPGRFLAITLKDPSGSIDLLVWSENEINELTSRGIKEEDVLLVIGAKLNKGNRGDHLGLAQPFIIKIDPPEIVQEVLFNKQEYDFLALDQIEKNIGSTVDIKGVLVEKGRPITFERKDGTEGVVLHLKVFDSSATVSITLWDPIAEMASELTISQEVVFRDLRVKNEDGGVILHSTGNTTIGS